jgi:hypothetical protein
MQFGNCACSIEKEITASVKVKNFFIKKDLIQLSWGPVRKFFRGKTNRSFSKGGVTKNKECILKLINFHEA